MPSNANVSITDAGTTAVVSIVGFGPFAFIRVWGYELIPGGTTNLTLKDGATAMVGPMPVAAGGGLVKNIGQGPAFDCSKGNNLNLVSDGSMVAVGGSVQYEIVMP